MILLRGRITAGEWAQLWLQSRSHLKPKTVAGYASLLRCQVRPRWQSVQLGAITYSSVAMWVADLSAAGLSLLGFARLTGMLDEAVKDGRLVRNPARGVDLPSVSGADRCFVSHEQLNRLASAAEPYRVLVLGYCGLRCGEATALRSGTSISSEDG